MKRRNFFSVCAGAGLALLGYKAAESSVTEPWNVKAAAQGRLDLMRRNNETIANAKEQITFYAAFREEHLDKVVLGELTGLLIFVDDKGYCTFDPNNRHIGYVKAVDDNGILVTLDNKFSKFELHHIEHLIDYTKLEDRL